MSSLICAEEPAPWPVIGASEQASISAGQASPASGGVQLGIERQHVGQGGVGVEEEAGLEGLGLADLQQEQHSQDRHRDAPRSDTASDGLHNSKTMRTAEDIREPVSPAMRTTLTPTSMVRRQEGALIVATTNITARLIATGRTDSSSPGEPAEHAYGHQ